MDETPPHRFGQRPARALSDIPSDQAFLSWREGHNAAVVVCALAEDALLHADGDPPAEAPDRAILSLALQRQWSAGEGESRVPAYARLLTEIDRDAERRATWIQATNRCDEGAQLHSSQPQRALELYQDGLKLFETLGDEKGAGRCRGNIGQLLIDHELAEQGVGECMQAIDLHAALHYDRGVLMHLGNVMRVLGKLSRWDDALTFAHERVALSHRSDPSRLTAAYADLGSCALQLGRRDEAERAYAEATAALDLVQMPAALQAQYERVGGLAHALGRLDDLQRDMPRVQQRIMVGLQILDAPVLPPLGTILTAFRQAVDRHDTSGMYEALAQSACWSALVFEHVLAEQLKTTIINENDSAHQWNLLARRLALACCLSFVDRGPFDEYALYGAWTLDQRVMKARAYALKIGAIQQEAEQDHESAHLSLTAAQALHSMIGDRDAAGPWFPEAFRELAVPSPTRGEFHRLMVRAAQAPFVGDTADDTRRTLEALLEAASREGTTLDVTDAYTRLAIHSAAQQQAVQSDEWFARADAGFTSLEAIGISVRDESGRAHNKLKMLVHLIEFLEREGRYGEAALVGVPALREAGWFIESFGPDDYVTRAKNYKSRMLNVLSRAYERLGSYEKALGYADRMCAWAEETGDRSALAAAHHLRAWALRSLLNPADALVSAKIDVDLQRELGNRREIAIALVAAAEIHADLGAFEEAGRIAAEALDYAGDDPSASAERRDARYALARVADATGAREDAIRLYSAVLEEEEAAPGHAWIVTAGILAARLVAADRIAEATRIAERAWAASAQVHAPTPRLAAGSALARCRLAMNTLAGTREAIDILLECCRLVEGIRAEMRDEWHKTAAAQARLEPFELLLAVLVDVIVIDPNPQWKRLAFQVAERAKARALAESIAASAAHAAEATGFQFTGLTVRPVDPREQITRAEFNEVRDMLREDAGLARS